MIKAFGASITGSSGINADKYFISSDNKLLAVSDGASGAYDKVGASACCIGPLLEYEYNESDIQPVDYIHRIFSTANQRLIDKSMQDGKSSFATLTIAMEKDGVLYVGAVGDTPAFLVRDGVVTKLTNPRKAYTKLVELGILTNEQAESAVAALPPEMRSVFDKFIPSIVPEVSITQYGVNVGDILIICTDGISDVIPQDEYPKLINTCNDVEKACATFIDKVAEYSIHCQIDDATLVIARL